jgi:hypothetical protein
MKQTPESTGASAPTTATWWLWKIVMEGQDLLLDLVQVSKHCPGQGSDAPVAGGGAAMAVLGSHMKETSKLISN